MTHSLKLAVNRALKLAVSWAPDHAVHIVPLVPL